MTIWTVLALFILGACVWMIYEQGRRNLEEINKLRHRIDQLTGEAPPNHPNCLSRMIDPEETLKAFRLIPKKNHGKTGDRVEKKARK